MELPENFLTPSEREEIATLADSMDIVADVFEGNGTTESLRMGIAIMRHGANILEGAADRIESENA